MISGAGIHIRWADGELRAMPGTIVTIGRDPGSNVVLGAPSVSRRHAELRFERRTWTLSDLGSRRGSHAPKGRIQRRAITTTTEIVFGDPTRGDRVVLTPERGDGTQPATDIGRPPTPGASDHATRRPSPRTGGDLRPRPTDDRTIAGAHALRASVGASSIVLVPGQAATIGRDKGCELVSTNPTVSRRHAGLRFVGDAWRLDDLGSTGGMFVDGSPVRTVELVRPTTVFIGDPVTGDRMLLAVGGAALRPERLGAPLPAAPAPSALSRRPLRSAGLALAAAVVLVGGLALRSLSAAPVVSADALARGTVRIVVNGGSGSGTIVDARRGLVLTNAHVVHPRAPGQALGTGKTADELDRDPDQILIAVSAGLDRAAEVRFQGAVVASDGYLDLAVVKITKTVGGVAVDARDLASLTEFAMGDSDSVRTGDAIRVLGYPDIAASDAPSVSDGLMASPAADERLASNRAEFNTTASIAPGDSGGAATDRHGHLIGVPSAGRIDKASQSKVGVVRPINFARDLIARARAGTAYDSPFVTPLGQEAVTGLRPLNGLASSGFANGCSSAAAEPKPGDRSLTMALDYEGFPVGRHQDVVVTVRANGKVVGSVESGSQFPFSWKGTGCATVTVPLASQLAPATDYRVVALIGPNHERTFEAEPFSVGPGAGPAPAAPAAPAAPSAAAPAP